MFHELGERLRRLEQEAELYREAFISVATRQGVEVPAFVRQESGGPGEGEMTRVELLRRWLQEMLPEEPSVTTTRSGSRARGRKGEPYPRGGGRGKQRRGGHDSEGGAEVT
jgi:hypothetical protein